MSNELQSPNLKEHRAYTPVLGLLDDAEPGVVGEKLSEPVSVRENEPAAGFHATHEGTIELSVIIPARNEEENIGSCLDSLVMQSESFFALGQDWEILVVDDGSTDGTAELAGTKSGVTVLEAEPLKNGWTGKSNAVWTAAKQARGRWLLFTDADTVHEKGNLRRAMHEAQKYKAGLLSYSPRQLTGGWAQRSLMPLVFCELALAYPPARVSDPAEKLAAANGQFLLFSREAYRKIGGHEAVANRILEDVELAVLAKKRGVGLRFRYAPDALSTRMYRTDVQMNEGWSKNLALLFGNCRALAIWRIVDIFLLFGLPVLAVIYWRLQIAPLVWIPWLTAGVLIAVLWVRNLFRFYGRVRKSNFPWSDCLITPFGLPRFVYLALRSWWWHSVKKQVEWKGRSYGGQ
jgi:glycosyltransferase involved in cell wall biosynthesis